MNDDGNLDQEEQAAIREWLRTKDVKRCPFSNLSFQSPSNYWYCGKVCPTIFPRLGGCAVNCCPCYQYAKSYVVRKARLILARKGRLRRDKTK